MANIRTLDRSFGGGELTPEFFGRIDDVKYQSGLAKCRNFITLPHGPATNRPGTAFVREVKTSAKRTRLIPFSYSTTQTMVLEFGDQYIRFHTNGSTLMGATREAVTNGEFATNITGWTDASTAPATIAWDAGSGGRLKLNSSGTATIARQQITTVIGVTYSVTIDVQTVNVNLRLGTSAGGTQYFSYALLPTGVSTYTFTATATTAWVDIHSASTNFIKSISITGVETPTAPYEVATPYLEADLFDLHYVQSADVLTICHPNYAPRELRRLGANNWTLSTILFASAVLAPTSVSAVATVGSGSTTYSYKVTAVGENGLDESLASAAASITNDLLTSGNMNTISWSSVVGAVRYNIYKQENGSLYGYIGQSDGVSFIDDNIAGNIALTPPLLYTPFTGTGNFPGAVSYFEQRRCFAGTTNAPQTIWLTRTGTESNLTYSLPTQDDDSINFRVAAREANTIRHIVPMNNLILLTSSAEWRVGAGSDALTPTTVSVKPQSYVGSSNVQPVIVNNNLIYAAARGGHMRELAYNWQASGYITGDLCLRAPHLFDGFTIVDLAYAKAPVPIVWCISSTGKLLGLTYVPEQQVGGWHHHDTDGTFESCCVVAEGEEDRLYVVVKRTVGGNTKRFVERMASRYAATQSDAFFVDNGSTFDGTNTTATTVTVTGGTTWGPADSLTITASAALFAYPAQTDVNDAIVFTATDGAIYRLTITSTTSTTVAQARVDKVLPVAFRSTAILSYAFARDTITGLTWLEGKTVNILADGAVHPQRTVTSGAITLDQASTKVQVGLPITADLQTLPWAAQIDAAFGQGRMKNVNKIWLRVFKSSGIFAGPDAAHLTEAKQRTTEPYGSPPELKSQEIEIVIDPSWNDSGQVFIRQSDPLPLTAVSMTMEVSIGA